MGARSRKRGRTAKPEQPRLRGEAANEAVRSELKPLGDDERPPALVVAVLVSAALGAGNLIAYVAGAEIDGKRPQPGGIISFSILMFVMAWGMWHKRYWALLGFQALLALVVIAFAVLLATASNLLAVALCVGVTVLGGWLFWKLVRVLSRVQMPERPGR